MLVVRLICITVVAGAAVLPAAAAATDPAPLVIAHRGASGLRPEHTLAAYELALTQGADFIELDLVASGDGTLIARHENLLAAVVLDEQGGIVRASGGEPRVRWQTTDVASRPEFADRLMVKQVDGRRMGGWFSEDFTAAEIASLRARERMPEVRPGNRLHDDRYGIPTLEEVVALVRDFERRTGSRPGLYIEIKHPTYFLHEGRRRDGAPIDLDLGLGLLDELSRLGFVGSQRLFIQCFEVAPLLAIKAQLAVRALDIPLIQLFGDIFNLRYRAAPRDLIYHAREGSLDRYGELATLVPGGLTGELSYAELATPAVLEFMARRYAAGIGPPVHNVLLTEIDEAVGRPRFTGEVGRLLKDARAAGLLVHPYTLRAEARFRLLYQGRPLGVTEEALLLLDAGANGFFIDQPDQGRLAVDRHMGAGSP
jgi:glycerophosphoryl diester phosphodiesterase